MEATLQRIIIPNNPGTGDDAGGERSSRRRPQPRRSGRRWVTGEDPVKLQQSAFAGAGVTGASTPDVNMGAKRPGSLPANHESVFQLEGGRGIAGLQ